MSEKKIYPHANHRQRVRKAFREAGADSASERSILEMILFYSIPRKDTNDIAAALLDKYGSLKAVFDAPYDELIKIEGLGESSALLLTMMPGISRRYSGAAVKSNALFEPGSEKEYIKNLLSGKESEEFLIICYDALGLPVSCKTLAGGDAECVSVDKRAVLEAAFECDADSVIIAHNHPLGSAAPSHSDAVLTREAANLLMQTGIRLSDHIIVGKDGVLSLASTVKFSKLFKGESADE